MRTTESTEFTHSKGSAGMIELAVAPVRHGPFHGRLAPEAIAAYAAATGDSTTAVLDGLAVPAVFPVILVFTPQEAARADVPAAAWQHVRGGVHGEHDIVLHRPLIPGERLETSSWISAVRTSRAGTQIVVQFEQVGADGSVAVEQWWTMMLLGLSGVADLGTMPADHRFPDEVRPHPLGSATQHVDKRMAHRYAAVSGDWSAHHFDVEVARSAGFGFVFTHGLCTLAICTHRLLDLLGVDDPGRVARVAVRFASPTPLDEELTVNAYGIEQNSFAFEATSRGVPTITHGRLELRS
jgi:acyl dehydratase